MQFEIIKELISNYRNGISIKKLIENINQKEISQKNIEDIMKCNEIIKINDIVFLRTAFLKQKNDFFLEFSDFIDSKITDVNIKKDLISLFMIYTSDKLFYKWIDSPLEKKLLIFDILLSFVIKQNHSDQLKKFIDNLIEFYSLLAINLILISKNLNNELSSFLKVIEKIEKSETVLKKQLFDILTETLTANARLDYYKNEFTLAKKRIKRILKNFYKTVLYYSPLIFKRVVKTEIKRFNIFSLLSRYDYDLLYEWITTISDNSSQFNRNLFQDLGL